jgi:Holliday junction DNA helicase RuvA
MFGERGTIEMPSDIIVDMIARITGQLEEVASSTVQVRIGGVTYELLVSPYTAGRIGHSIGQEVTLETLHYLEGQSGGSTLYPRLAGFLSAIDKDFFELFTTCNGVGNKTALAAMVVGVDQIAAAIAERDVAMLQSLPKIGRRTAETLIASLSGKVDRFLSAPGTAPAPAIEPAKKGKIAKMKIEPVKAAAIAAVAPTAPAAPAGDAAEQRQVRRDAIETLVALGEDRATAMTWVEQVTRDGFKPADAQALIKRIYEARG